MLIVKLKEKDRMSVLSSYETPWQYESTFNEAVPRSFAGIAKIEEYTFPPSVSPVRVGVSYPVRMLIHNVGEPGIIAGGVVNVGGNPGTFTFIDPNGLETEISPGNYVRTSSVGDVPNCNMIEIKKHIRFNSEGTYNIKLWAMHEEAGKWFYDQQINLFIPVASDEPPNGGAVVKRVHVFDNVRLKAEGWDIWKKRTNSIIDISPLLLEGARLDYTVQYIGGTPIAEVAKIDFNEVNIVTERLTKGEAKSGSVPLTGLVGQSASITIKFESFPGFTSTVLFDVWLILEYSEKPPEDPKTPFNWEEIINKYGKWVALGVTGIVVLSLMRRPSAPIIVLPGFGGGSRRVDYRNRGRR